MQNANYIGFWKQESFFQIMSNTLKAVCILEFKSNREDFAGVHWSWWWF